MKLMHLLVLSALLPAPSRAQSADVYTAVWQPSTEGEIQVYGWTYPDFKAKYDQLWGQGWRLKLLNPYVVNGQVRYTAVWRPSSEGEVQVYGWTYTSFKTKYDQLWGQGWRLKLLSPYVINGQVRYTAVWRPSSEAEVQVYGWTYSTFKAKYDQLWGQGWRLKLLSPYVVAGQVRYTAVWRKSTEAEVQVYGWTYSTFKAKYDQLWGQGWRLKLLSPYVVGTQVRYTAVWRKSTEGEVQVYGWSFPNLKAKYDQLWGQGWRLKLLSVMAPSATTVAVGPLTEGGLYKEATSPEVYLFLGGRRIWIPTPAALEAMGFTWAQVQEVPAGTLAGYPRFDIPSASPTPSSVVFTPAGGTQKYPLQGIPGATRLVLRGREVQLGELYGWLRGVDGGCGDERDFHYRLELDTDWALSKGMDLHKVLRVANLANDYGRWVTTPPRRAVGLPLVIVELDSWESGRAASGGQKPGDWTHVRNCTSGGRTWNLTFPYDPNRPIPGPRLDSASQAQGTEPAPFMPELSKRGPYVRMAGSLVTDHPHDAGRPDAFLSRVLAWPQDEATEWEGSVADWHPGVASENPNHYARWSEIHPVDLVEVLPWKEPRVTVRGVALAARVGVLPGGFSNSCESAEFDLAPEAARPANTQIGYEELRGPETHFPWGEDANNGSWITAFDDHIGVKARVCGGALGGSPGRFKALYRVWWKAVPPGTVASRSGSFVTSDADQIRFEIDPGVVAADIVSFELCLGAGLTWEKRMNLPDGQGSSWNVVVKDNTRCDNESLWATQVANGQSLTFSKAKTIGIMTAVHQLPISNLGSLPGGTRVKFIWVKD